MLTESGYGGLKCITPPQHTHPMAGNFALMRACHEAVSGRFKFFHVLASTFYHSRDLRGACFIAVANNVSLTLEELPMFTV